MISYDIAGPRRLGRVYRLLKKQGLPVQYSDFTVALTRIRLQHLLALISQVIDEREDDVRCYALPEKKECDKVGVQFFSSGIMLFIDGVDFLVL